MGRSGWPQATPGGQARSSDWRSGCAPPSGSWRSPSSTSAPPPSPDWPPSRSWDLVIGLAPGTDPDWVITALPPLGYQFRGDKGGDGGLLLVVEDRPAHRVAHLHLVGHGDAQWRRYLALRDRLRADPAARAAYAQLKGRLAAQFSGDRGADTAAKAAFIVQLLSEDRQLR
jgi:hypothetical protein